MIRRILLAAFLVTASVYSEPISQSKAEELRGRFQERQQQTKSWSAAFSQIISMPGMREPVTSKGTLSYQSPDRLRLDFTKPDGEFALVVGDQVFLQKTGKKLAEKSLSEDNAGKPFEMLLGLLRGQSRDEEKDYQPTIMREKDRYVIVLAKKDGASRRLPKRITNTLDADSMEIREVLVELPNDGTIHYRFEEVSRNRPLDAARFAPPVK